MQSRLLMLAHSRGDEAKVEQPTYQGHDCHDYRYRLDKLPGLFLGFSKIIPEPARWHDDSDGGCNYQEDLGDSTMVNLNRPSSKSDCEDKEYATDDHNIVKRCIYLCPGRASLIVLHQLTPVLSDWICTV